MSNLQALVLFNIFVLGALGLDLQVFHPHARLLSFREAVLRSAAWIGLALACNVLLYFWRGPESALEFLAGYILEKSLSMDNVFVFSVIFTSWAVSPSHQHSVLFWGILGALVMRGALVAAGVALLSHFHYALYLFGFFLVYTGARFLVTKRGEVHPERNPMLRLARKVLPITEDYEGGSFFVRRNGQLFATPLLLVLVMVESADVLFALDSIPAVFGVTEDPFIVYTSNVFALLGLRALYFLLAGAIARFRHLRTGLSLVLVFVGTKMLAAYFYKISTLLSLGVISGIIGVAIFLSIRAARKSTR